MKGKYVKDKQVGRAARLSPTFNDLKKMWDYNGSVALDASQAVLYLIEVQVDFGDGAGYSTIVSKPYNPK